MLELDKKVMVTVILFQIAAIPDSNQEGGTAKLAREGGSRDWKNIRT